ncbi:MAG: glycoside hydrolase family 108 protein [Caulobacter sp.]|nr:glycoside hydrolase family 108 protein [Caulobacter sp.]
MTTAPALTEDFRYRRSEAVILGYEGLWSNNPKDPGGATWKGITLRALSEWRGKLCTAEQLRALSDDEISAIYRVKHWATVRAGELPPGLDLIVFDSSVNQGRRRAGACLQEALGVSIDGAVGPVTLRAVAGVNDLVGLIERVRRSRLAHYRSLDTFPTFGTGWVRRLNGVAQTATLWARRA